MTAECQVVYFLVEVRKFCERTGYKNELLMFYCDWALHARKSRPVDAMNRIVELVYAGLTVQFKSGVTSPEFAAFFEMSALRISVRQWLRHAGESDELVESNRHWKAFRDLLANVLADQEIVTKDSPTVSSIHFQANDGTCIVRFRQPIGRKTEFRGRA